MILDILYDSFKDISLLLKNEDLNLLAEETKFKNSSKDIKKNIDVKTNEIIRKAFELLPEINGYISEEEEDLIIKDNSLEIGYILIVDPCDGSNNIISNLAVGTIYGIYKYDFVNNYIMDIYECGYALYGPSTLLIRSETNKLKLFHLNAENKFNFVRSLRCSYSGKMYCINESYSYDNDIKNLVFYFKQYNYTQRWTGAMVADCHNIIMNGGVFIYPATKKNPSGKIRLLYEALPFSYLFSLIGGKGVDTNFSDIKDKIPYINVKSKIHSNITVMLMTQGEYEKLKTYKSDCELTN